MIQRKFKGRGQSLYKKQINAPRFSSMKCPKKGEGRESEAKKQISGQMRII
jgi:hypothetical protein